jgi:hypothetical protein
MRQEIVEKLLSPTALSCLYTRGLASRHDNRQYVPVGPNIPSIEQRVLGARLLLEEVLEACEKLGLVITPKGHPETVLKKGADSFNYGEAPGDALSVDWAESVDACCDVRYVAAWMLVGLGAPDIPHDTEVWACNNAKFPGGVAIVDENGKYQKPPGWVPPDHDAVRDAYNVNLHQVSEDLIAAAQVSQ